MKSAFISIIGRPSAGKSTLLNKLCGEKVSIVSSTPQTTRNKIRGIVNREPGQLVFIDTPGYHFSEKKFNQYLSESAVSALEESDLVLYVMDGTRAPGTEEARIMELLSPLKRQVIAVVNKQDLPGFKADSHREILDRELPGVPVLTASAESGDGIDELFDALFEASPEGDPLYPVDFYTDQEPEFRITEIIREKAIARGKEELPHSIYVDIEDLERDEENAKLWIRAVIYVERESQKGIVVGKGGKGIKAIRVESQRELGKLFAYRIHLDLRVKVNKKWRRKDNLIERLTQ